MLGSNSGSVHTGWVLSANASPHISIQKRLGLEEVTGCRVFLAFREALPTFSESRDLTAFEANPGRSCPEQGSQLHRHSGKSPPSAQTLARGSCQQAILQLAKQ